MFMDVDGQMVTTTTTSTVLIVGEQNKQQAEHEQRFETETILSI